MGQSNSRGQCLCINCIHNATPVLGAAVRYDTAGWYDLIRLFLGGCDSQR